jgi:hypothetical protein
VPSISNFSSYMAKYSKEVTQKAQEAYKSAAMVGSAFMKAVISDGAPTGTRWHLEKNIANRYGTGARIGSRIQFQGYAPSAAPGTMLRSVERGSIEQSPGGFSVAFGWLNKKEEYFGQQDLGNYRPNGVGMGLLNKGSNGGRDMGAALAAEAELMKKMKSAKFKVKGNFF